MIDSFFDKIFIINLERRPDRLEKVISNLDRINLSKYEIFTAVDGYSIGQTGWEGLRQTYIKIFNIIKNSGCNNFLLIEDDCEFNDNFQEEVEIYLREIPSDYDLIYFGGNHFSKPEHRFEKINSHVIRTYSTVTTHCIGFSTKNFGIIYDKITNEKDHVDLILAKLQNELNTYSSIKNLTTQTPSHSDIENRFVNYDYVLRYNFL
jgi:GR25 family glycosyltransferase involved in LPS biosynthesis